MRILDALAFFNPARAEQGQGRADEAQAGKSQQAPGANPANGGLPDDAVTLREQEAQATRSPKLALGEYKHRVAEDRAFINATLKHKLAEYDLNPQTRLAVRKNTLGQLELQGHLQPESRERIESDLNQNQAFRAAFDRLAVNLPTLDFVDNVMKISRAYGANNSLFNSLVSQNEQFNGLQDIAHRYQSMRSNLGDSEGIAKPEGFRLELTG